MPKKDKRTDGIRIRLTDAERKLWDTHAAEHFQDTSTFVRQIVNDYIFGKHTQQHLPGVDMGPILQELKEFQSLIRERDNMYEIERKMIVENLSRHSKKDQTLEERILTHLGNRTLYTTQIIEYMQEDPEIIIPLLSKMEKEKKVIQDKQTRWRIYGT